MTVITVKLQKQPVEVLISPPQNGSSTPMATSMSAPSSQMLTANRLTDGDVLYWKAGNWVLFLQEGEVFTDEEAAKAALEAANAKLTENKFVAPYLFDVRVENGAIKPVKEREIIRAAGPTVQRHLGKQAGQVNV
jgi:hypothetical protein